MDKLKIVLELSKELQQQLNDRGTSIEELIRQKYHDLQIIHEQMVYENEPKKKDLL